MTRRAKIITAAGPLVGVFWIIGFVLEQQEQANVARGCQILRTVTGDESTRVTCKQHARNLSSGNDSKTAFRLCVDGGQLTYKESFRRTSVPRETTDEIAKACAMMMFGTDEATIERRWGNNRS
jgi:hypothetical protein